MRKIIFLFQSEQVCCSLLNCFFFFPLNKSDNKEMDTSFFFFLTADYNEINFKKASQEQWVRQL